MAAAAAAADGFERWSREVAKAKNRERCLAAGLYLSIGACFVLYAVLCPGTTYRTRALCWQTAMFSAVVAGVRMSIKDPQPSLDAFERKLARSV